MMENFRAFLFDLNGTMIDDMHYHLLGWHQILTEDLGARLTLEELKGEMYGKNQELLDRIFGKGKISGERAQEVSMEKERRYQAAYKPHLALIMGLDGFLEKAAKTGIKMGIGSAAIMFNIDFVLDNLHIRQYFDAIVSADHVQVSKPDPEVFLKAAAQLGMAAKNCLVFEDAPKGVEAAHNAGMKCIVLTTMHEKEEFSQYKNIVRFIADYTDPSLDELFI